MKIPNKINENNLFVIVWQTTTLVDCIIRILHFVVNIISYIEISLCLKAVGLSIVPGKNQGIGFQ